MAITIKVRPCCGAYLARAVRLGVSASCAEGPTAAARAVCRKLGIDPDALEQSSSDPVVVVFTHHGQATQS